MPALGPDTVFPAPSVIVMMVLLKVAATCATPWTTFFFSFLRARPAPFFSAAILLRHLLFPGDRLGRAFARARVRMSALPTHRKPAAMTQTAIADEIHQPLDVHRHFAAEIALHQIIAVDDFADLDHFGIGEIADAAVLLNANLLADLLGFGLADAMDVAQADFDPLLGWNIDAGNARHCCLLGLLSR